MGVRFTNRRAGTRFALAGVLVLSVAAGCGSSSKSSAVTTNTIDAGQVNIQLPDGWKVTKGGAIQPATDSGATAAPGAAGASGASGSSGASSDTIPLASTDPQTKFFGALSSFSSCLRGLGTKFLGIPDSKNPSSPANDPAYIKSLSTCAAKSNIVGALKDYGTFQDNLTPAQVETQNKAFLKWRDCMIGRGWGIPQPKPDSKGRLFSIGTSSGGNVPNFTPPPGQDIVTSSDVQECAAQVAKEDPTVTSTSTGG